MRYLHILGQFRQWSLQTDFHLTWHKHAVFVSCLCRDAMFVPCLCQCIPGRNWYICVCAMLVQVVIVCKISLLQRRNSYGRQLECPIVRVNPDGKNLLVSRRNWYDVEICHCLGSRRNSFGRQESCKREKCLLHVGIELLHGLF